MFSKEEQALFSRLEVYRAILDLLSQAVLFATRRGVLYYANKSAEVLLKKNKHEIEGQRIDELFTCLEIRQEIAKILNGEQADSIILRHEFEGTEVMMHGLSFFDGLLLILDDQTEKNAIYSELNAIRNLNQELSSVIASSYDGIIITDNKGKIIKANQSVERISGLKPEDFMQKNIFQLENEGYILQKEIYSKKDARIIRQRLKTGKDVLVTSMHIYDSNERLSYIISNIKDLKELQEHMASPNANPPEPEINQKYYDHLLRLRKQAGNLIFDSAEMSQVVEKAYQVSRVNATVLLLGESGVGKEVIARFIHSNSLRKNSPFIVINCGAIPVNLLESELFGHEKGAFTGAQERKYGLLELAHQGTLFLDEIAELHIGLQTKMLRFLQDKKINRVGGKELIPLDVRIISASNRNLEKMVAERLFREDLFYRLNVIPIEIPALRKRKNDIKVLANYFLAEFKEKHNIQKRMAPELINALDNYDWPGNVRELENIMEYLVVMSKNETIGLQDLPKTFRRSAASRLEVKVNELVPLKEAKEAVEKEVILAAMQRHRSSRKIAEALKMDHSTIFRKMKKYDLLKEKFPPHKANGK